MSELIIAEDENGNTFQVTPEDAEKLGYTPVPQKGDKAKAAAEARAGAKDDETKRGAKAVEKSDAAVEDKAVGGPEPKDRR